MKILGILFRDDRGKNLQTLLSLEIPPAYRNTVLESLTVEDYSQGPLAEILYGGSELWVFGKTIKKKEIYIKITMGHLEEGLFVYPFILQKRK